MAETKDVKRGSPPEGFITAKKAKELLGNISDWKLRDYALTQARIHIYTPIGRKQGFYNEKDVRTLAKELESMDRGIAPVFSMATAEDMPDTVNFLIEMFGGSNTTERRLGWLQRNPEIAFIARQPGENRQDKGRVIGCAFAVPLTLSKINQLLQDATPATRLIDAQDIQPYQIDKPTNIFIFGLAVSGINRQIKRFRGFVILRGLVHFLESLGKRGIEIQLVAASSDQPDGVRILSSFFTEIESSLKNEDDEPIHAFILRVRASGHEILKPYKTTLANWRKEHNQPVKPFEPAEEFFNLAQD